MKAIPLRGRLIGKRIAGFLWAGQGKDWIRCTGTLCEVKSNGPNGRVLETTTLQLPNSRER